MHRDQTLPQPSLRTGTRVQKVDVSALATRRNCSFYLFEGMGINSHIGGPPPFPLPSALASPPPYSMSAQVLGLVTAGSFRQAGSSEIDLAGGRPHPAG